MDIFQHYSTLLDKVLQGNSTYWKTWLQAPFSISRTYMGKSVYVSCGVDRAAIVDMDCDWIVKFGLESTDQCDSELQLYDRAKHEGMAKYLCECRYVGTYERTIQFWNYVVADNFIWEDKDEFEKRFRAIKNGLGPRMNIQIELPLYAYKRATKADFNFGLSKEELEFCDSYHTSPLTHCYKEVAIRFKNTYGIEEFEKFSECCNNYGINDLHIGNVGMVDGRFVVIDWASCD